MDWLPQEKTFVLASTFDTNTVLPRTGVSLHRERTTLLRRYPSLAGYGLYLANLLTYDQVEVIAQWD
jgi:hypothetical protein